MIGFIKLLVISSMAFMFLVKDAYLKYRCGTYQILKSQINGFLSNIFFTFKSSDAYDFRLKHFEIV